MVAALRGRNILSLSQPGQHSKILSPKKKKKKIKDLKELFEVR